MIDLNKNQWRIITAIVFLLIISFFLLFTTLIDIEKKKDYFITQIVASLDSIGNIQRLVNEKLRVEQLVLNKINITDNSEILLSINNELENELELYAEYDANEEDLYKFSLLREKINSYNEIISNIKDDDIYLSVIIDEIFFLMYRLKDINDGYVTDFDLFFNDHINNIKMISLAFWVVMIIAIISLYKGIYIINRTKKMLAVDPLTGCFNRRFINSYNIEKPISVAIIDIDFFKKVNDKYGHLCGDHLLINFSSILRKSFRNQDIIRFGGEEFIVIIDSASLDDAALACERFRKKIMSHNFKYEKQNIKITCSIGICNKNEYDLDEIILNADKALYKAKNSGRNKTILYNK